MADRMYGRPAAPTDTTISSADWDSRDLTGENHENVLFADLDMTEATGVGAVFTDCTFRGARFNASTHTDAAFVNCTFVRCGFFDATFTGCKLVGSMFDGCTYDLLKVKGGDWSFTGLPGADLRRASFKDARMREVDLTGARCAGAEFRDVDLSGSVLHKADFSGCDLRGSDISAIDPFTVGLRRAVIDPFQAVVLATALGLDVRD
ncbi:pentapeptide repeat-containing protein [Actinomadura soli]|uniref:Pentapeptide repeat-containing protein n=1 Tax=Actinomadura soli TaxID=2508997 RepID=A0A5C4J4N3_9ACTN|nr:pentapeptide repeat-containing protein [Actinomadura soli]TMQ91723.1 pentapeptide repeat-containing protein [Actinomadura soli]